MKKRTPKQIELAELYGTTTRSVRTWQAKGAPVWNLAELHDWLCRRAHIRYRRYERDPDLLEQLKEKYRQ